MGGGESTVIGNNFDYRYDEIEIVTPNNVGCESIGSILRFNNSKGIYTCRVISENIDYQKDSELEVKYNYKQLISQDFVIE